MQHLQRDGPHHQFKQCRPAVSAHHQLIATEMLGQPANGFGHVANLTVNSIGRARSIEQLARRLQLLLALVLVKQRDLFVRSKAADIVESGGWTLTRCT